MFTEGTHFQNTAVRFQQRERGRRLAGNVQRIGAPEVDVLAFAPHTWSRFGMSQCACRFLRLMLFDGDG